MHPLDVATSTNTSQHILIGLLSLLEIELSFVRNRRVEHISDFIIPNRGTRAKALFWS